MTHCIMAPMALLVSIIVLGMSGCGTTRDQSDKLVIHITLSSSGTLEIDGKKTSTAELARKVKSMGATPRSRIEIAVPSDTSASAMADIARALATGGYRRVIFIKPRQFNVTTTNAPVRSNAGSSRHSAR
jgi:biopolymer transport protein ExbD